jgi:cyanophycin synthetase
MTLEDLVRVKRCVVEAVPAQGTAVLNAQDPLVAEMAARCPGSVCWFAREPGHPIIRGHRAEGGRAVLEREGVIVLARGSDEEVLLTLAQTPRGGVQVESTLAAIAAAWALDTPLDQIRAGLRSAPPTNP